MTRTTSFDDVMSQLDTPMVVVTTVAGDERAGCLVGFHTQCSIDPPRYALWLSKANHTYRVALHAAHFAVHFLDVGHEALAELFGSVTDDTAEPGTFERCRWHAGPGGVPLLDDCPTRVVGRPVDLIDSGGDHVCVVLEPVESTVGESLTPLQLSQVRHLPPGHEADEPT